MESLEYEERDSRRLILSSDFVGNSVIRETSPVTEFLLPNEANEAKVCFRF